MWYLICFCCSPVHLSLLWVFVVTLGGGGCLLHLQEAWCLCICCFCSCQWEIHSHFWRWEAGRWSTAYSILCLPAIWALLEVLRWHVFFCFSPYLSLWRYQDILWVEHFCLLLTYYIPAIHYDGDDGVRLIRWWWYWFSFSDGSEYWYDAQVIHLTVHCLHLWYIISWLRCCWWLPRHLDCCGVVTFTFILRWRWWWRVRFVLFSTCLFYSWQTWWSVVRSLFSSCGMDGYGDYMMPHFAVPFVAAVYLSWNYGD
jgi:hypothetical protein